MGQENGGKLGGKWGGSGQPVSSFDGHFDGFASNQFAHRQGPHKGSEMGIEDGARKSICICIFSALWQMYLHVLCRHLLAIFILALRIGGRAKTRWASHSNHPLHRENIEWVC